jgi:hypothetical protein
VARHCVAAAHTRLLVAVGAVVSYSFVEHVLRPAQTRLESEVGATDWYCVGEHCETLRHSVFENAVA